MRTLRHFNRENRPYFYFNSMINIKIFDPNLLSIDQISFKKILIVLFITMNVSKILIVKTPFISFLIM